MIKQPKVFIPLIIILLIVAAFILAVRNLNAPAEGTINQTPSPTSEVVDPYSNPGKYSGKYISFSYPAHYKKIPSQKTGNYLETVSFFATNQTSKQISIGVLKESIEDDSGVNLRKLHPDTYHQQPRTQTGTIQFTSTANGSERTAFVPHQDKVAVFSITAPAGWDLAEDMQTMLNSLHWK